MDSRLLALYRNRLSLVSFGVEDRRCSGLKGVRLSRYYPSGPLSRLFCEERESIITTTLPARCERHLIKSGQSAGEGSRTIREHEVMIWC